MITIHVIFNAHIDPVWLWPWPAGLDEALATCRSACDRLDRHPDLTFTRGEAWIYRQIERLDPKLFARIGTFVEQGRWEIVGGWWIQPDCNLPSGFALEKQIAIGKEYFERTFGTFPKTAYNVDSFGHAASLPGYMRQFGQTHYIMMRPQEHEMALPARLFRWRGYEDGPEVVTFRIASAYTTREMSLDHVEKSLTGLPPGVQDTMCFVGVGDHGGGPTERQIAWVREYANAIPGCVMVPSSPARFFDAVAPLVSNLPLVVGELQMHAVGCYSVHRESKTSLRRAEHLLRQVDVTGALANARDQKQGWEYACFHQFHDTLGGTCLPSAYDQVERHLRYAQAQAEDSLIYHLRRRMNDLPDCERQRIVLWNASDAPFAGYVEAEPWIGWQEWQAHWKLVDAQGTEIPYQRIAAESVSFDMPRLLFAREMGADELRAVMIDTSPPSEISVSEAPFSPADRSPLGFGSFDAPLAGLRLEMVDDPSDTWSHNLDRYAEHGQSANWSAPDAIDHGPLMWSWKQTATIGTSRLTAEWRAYEDQPMAALILDVDWREKHKLLKLVLPTRSGPVRTDGIAGNSLERANDGCERPMRDWTCLTDADGSPHQIGIVCPDIFALDATPERARLTLLRSAIMAHHVPFSGESPRAVISDQGVHRFRFEFWPRLDASDTAEFLDRRSLQMQRPPLVAELTRGMREAS